ncbi:MAG: rod shape-determining protein MreC [Burkholderiales bacterium]
MEHSPPPFFKRGPAPVVRLAFFASLSLALLVLDARFHYTEGLRNVLALVAYPLQRIATAPSELGRRIGDYFATQSSLREENAQLRARMLAALQSAQRNEAAAAEGERLQRLIEAGEKLKRRTIPAEIIYAGRDPYALKVVVDKGTEHGVVPGSPVVDEGGVVGQVTGAHAFSSEVTLITDKGQAVPVQVLRSGLRAIAFGGGSSGLLELRFMAPNAEIANGDRLVTSGIDGTYPAGLPVATVVSVERDSAHDFARVLCKPAAGVDRGRFVLVLSGEAKPAPDFGRAEPVKPRRLAPRHTRKNDGVRSR